MLRGKNMMKMRMFVLLVMVMMVSPLLVEANSPALRLSIANYDPLPVQPGQFVDVWINVQNIGSGEARNIIVEYQESPFFELVNPADKVREIPVLGSFRDYSLKYRFKVADNVVEGANNLVFEHSIGSQPGVVATSNLRIDVKSTESPISVSSVKLSKDPVEPGEKTTLTIAVTNPSTSSNLRDVSVALQLTDQQGGALFNLPFAPVDSTNKKSINRILPGQTTEFRFDLVAYPDADSMIYKVPVLFSYYDDIGVRYDDVSFISINVNSEPDLFVIIESIAVNKGRHSGEVIFDIVNQGVSEVKLLTVTLGDSDFVKVTSASNKEYLGGIDSDDFKSARFHVRVTEDVDEVVFPLTLTYRDALNNEFVETVEVVHVLRDSEGNGNKSSLIIIVLVLLVLIGYWYYKRKQKKKMVRDDDN